MERTNAIKTVAITGIVGNVFLTLIKLLIGFATSSLTMIADGFNSAADVFSSVITYIGNNISARPESAAHPYGHGKAEYVFSLVISLMLMFVAFFVLRNAFFSLFLGSSFRYSFWLLVVAISSFVLKLGLYFVTIDAAREYNSILAYANATDHRNDILISLLTLISVIAGYFSIYFVDAIFGILVACWIAYSGATIFASCYNVLMDRTLDATITDKMRYTISTVKGVEHLDSLVSKPLGVNYLLIVKVSIDGNFTVFEGHNIAAEIKQKLLQFDQVEEAIVHLNPVQQHPHTNLLK